MGFVKVGEISDLQDGQAKTVEAGGNQIALIKKGGKFFALDNSCVHHGGPIGEGYIEGDNVVCPWHSWKYNVKTGISPVNPMAKLQVFNVKVEGKDILVEV